MDAIPQPSLPVTRSPREHSLTVESGKAFSLRDVLAIRKVCPFYTSDVMYPPNANAILAARERAAKETGEVELKCQPLLWKKDLPQNTFRQSIYTSMTGGGSGSKPLFFAADVHENRRHRALFGRFLRNIGLATEADWVVTVHPTGGLYRSLDLTLELLENAGATVLAAGYHMPPAVVVRLITQYSVNVLSGDSGQIVSMVHYISSLSQDERAKFNINKVIYTSETLTIAQRAHIRAVLGFDTQICSILGSAEGGPYAASCAHLSRDVGGRESDDSVIEEFQDFIIDERITKIEILPTSVPENDTSPDFTPVEDGQRGMIAQTSLTRLRNPLVRYITGDIGSLHKLPQKVEAMLPEQERQHMHMLRLYGRDRRFSFEWGGEYYEFRNLITLMDDVRLGILQWQVILEKSRVSEEALLEVRLLRSNGDMNGNLASKEELTKRIRIFFSLGAANEERFRLVFLHCFNEFELSPSGRTVIKFVDHFH
ncbi:coenzyme f390 synthetase [Colletotrichum incanum]|uniref:Coenzyme f390 synthetase n=1 Tax=Colletotrichum incanum TaxID=1573173 RepID=A0A161VZR3_COLIC|nr:coenzyme f390 synthetase [Colletotrichum incanum]